MTAPNVTFDAIIIGGGHNGLVAAAYLAKAKQKVLVLEARNVLGGMCATEELWPGYQVSSCAHVYPGLHPRIVRDLGLYRRGLKLTQRRMPTTAIGNDGEVLPLSLDKWESRASLAGYSAQDGKAYEVLLKDLSALGRFARSLGEIPAAEIDWQSEIAALLNGLDAGVADRAASLMFSSAADILNDRFETELLRGALAFDAGLGGLGPFEPASLASWALRASGEVSGVQMALGHPKGGMGSVATALADAATNAGAEIRTGATVKSCIMEGNTVCGVELSDGEAIGARAIIGAVAPPRVIQDMIAEECIEPDALRNLATPKLKGTVGTLRLALSKAPKVRGVEGASLLAGRLIIAPSIDHLQHSFAEAMAGRVPQDPAFEITIPTMHDDSLAPEGKHILCANILHLPFEPDGGWEKVREAYEARLISALGYYMPDLKASVEHLQFQSPEDIEATYGAPGGHWHHGALTYDNVGPFRYTSRASDGDIPLHGLYFASAGAHPGGGVTGLPGLLCANAVLADVAAL